jgi:type I site-specific restriction endonuclease
MSEFAVHFEDKARSLIDRQLVACGWLIQSKGEMNLGAGLGVAIREFQTGSGPVDYGLFVGRKLRGVIEAKAAGTTLSGFSEQAARYIADVPKHLVREEGQVRFEYVASGTETLFRDHADPDRADLSDFVTCYQSGHRSRREESEKFKRFPLVTLLARDKLNLDIFWLKDHTLDDPDLLPPPDEVAAEIVESLETALARFRSVAKALGEGPT